MAQCVQRSDAGSPALHPGHRLLYDGHLRCGKKSGTSSGASRYEEKLASSKGTFEVNVLHKHNKRWLISLLGCVLTPAVISTGHAVAQDLPPPQTPETPVSVRVQHVAIDGSGSATSLGDRSFDLSGTFAPFSEINESGFRIRLSESASWYRFISNQYPLTFGTGHTLESGVLAGYQLSLERISFLGLIGAAFAVGDDDGVHSTRWGAKSVLSMYARPSDQTMAYASASYSTIANFVQLQSKVGVKLVGDFYIGPEANFSWRNALSSTNNVSVIRIGGHISSVAFGPIQCGVSAGWARQQDLGSGYYGGANFYWTF